jgi:hypothetical protein
MKDDPFRIDAKQALIERAIEIIRAEFEHGLHECCQPSSLDRHYQEFQFERDPIMFPLIEGMRDKKLERAFVSFYDIYHTIVTRSRFWLTSALVKIILDQGQRFGRPVSHLFTRKSLAKSGLDLNRTIADMGDEVTEHLIGGTGSRQWKVNLDKSAFDEIEKLGTHYRMIYDTAGRYSPDGNTRQGLFDDQSDQDQKECDTIVSLLGHGVGPSTTPRVVHGVPIECDLLVISPHRSSDRQSVVAIRFVNPKTFKSRADVIDARLNLLQLRAFLAQQKPERPFDSIQTWVCEIVDRNIERSYPFFSERTYRSATQFWDEFIGVPFHLAREAIERIGQELLAQSLRERLPH